MLCSFLGAAFGALISSRRHYVLNVIGKVTPGGVALLEVLRSVDVR